MDEGRLTELFRRLGAREPESWAHSQLAEGIPQLARYLFLRQAWRDIVSEDDATWIDASISASRQFPDDPYAGVGHALRRLRSHGATDNDLTDVVRGMQAQLLFNLCYLLEDPGLSEEGLDVAWALFQTDRDGLPIAQVGGLHESVLETDPTGREMRPRPR
ncbi:MAG: hypothetical protein AB7T63_06025 [Planctomycetota bacterium]